MDVKRYSVWYAAQLTHPNHPPLAIRTTSKLYIDKKVKSNYVRGELDQLIRANGITPEIRALAKDYLNWKEINECEIRIRILDYRPTGADILPFKRVKK